MVAQIGLGGSLELGHDPVGQTLPSSTPHWSKRIDVPDRPGGEDGVLVEGHQAAEQPRA